MKNFARTLFVACLSTSAFAHTTGAPHIHPEAATNWILLGALVALAGFAFWGVRKLVSR